MLGMDISNSYNEHIPVYSMDRKMKRISISLVN